MPPSPSALRTLVIDDDEMSRELLTILLEAEGHRVEAAESGEAALAKLSQSGPTYLVILTDLHLPGIEGAELAVELRRACGPRPLLLAMSGSPPESAEVAAYDGFLLKPFPIEALAAALSNRGSRRSRISGLKTDDPPRQSHQSVTSPVTADVLSIAASGGGDASNLDMTVPIDEHDLELQIPQFDETTVENCTAGVSVLNEQIYGQLASSMPPFQLQEMYSLCINDARKRIAGMHCSVTERDSAQFVREAHAIKGGSGMLGATELHRLAAAIETCGLRTISQDVNSLDELCAACDRLERMLGSRV